MSVIGCILTRVFDEENVGASVVPASYTPPSRGTAQGPLTFPQVVDVDSILGKIAARRREKLNWRTSIVDLLKLLNLDSSFDARSQLAQELGYSGHAEDSAVMNSWLHRQVMKKLAESSPRVLNSYLN
jgi:hypothetical protein